MAQELRQMGGQVDLMQWMMMMMPLRDAGTKRCWELKRLKSSVMFILVVDA